MTADPDRPFAANSELIHAEALRAETRLLAGILASLATMTTVRRVSAYQCRAELPARTGSQVGGEFISL